MSIKTLWGLHLMASAYNYRQLIKDLQPSTITMLHPKPEDVALVREESPDTIIVGRMYRDDGWYSNGITNDPKGFAGEVHALVMATDWWQMVDYVQTNNEVSQSWQWVQGQAPSGIERLATYSSEWMRLARGNYHCGIGAFSEGNPDLQKGWTLFHAAMRQALLGGHALLIHEYGWPDFWNPPGKWNLGRFAARVYPTLPSDVKNIGVIISEIGQDRLIVGQKGGWKSSGNSARKTAEQLRDFHHDLNAWRRSGVNLLGTSLFCAGDVGWGDYDYAGDDLSSPLGLYRSMLPDHIEPLHLLPSEPEHLHPPHHQAMIDAANGSQSILLNPDAALQKRIYADGFAIVGTETPFTGPGGQKQMIQKAENLATGESRVYYVNTDDYSVVYKLTIKGATHNA